MKVKITENSPSHALIEVELALDEEACMMEEIAVKALVRGIEKRGYNPARTAFEGAWREYISGVLAGCYACHKSEEELLPLFRVLMALVGLAQDGFESVEEYRIVEGDD